AHGHDRVGAHRGRVLQHEVERFLAGPLAEPRVERDVAAEERLDGRAQVDDEVAGADRDAPHDAAVAHDAVPLELETGGDPLRVHGHGVPRALSGSDYTTEAP